MAVLRTWNGVWAALMVGHVQENRDHQEELGVKHGLEIQAGLHVLAHDGEQGQRHFDELLLRIDRKPKICDDRSNELFALRVDRLNAVFENLERKVDHESLHSVNVSRDGQKQQRCLRLNALRLEISAHVDRSIYELLGVVLDRVLVIRCDLEQWNDDLEVNVDTLCKHELGVHLLQR